VEQGLAWVEKETERMDGKVLAYEYLRAMAAMTAAHRMLSSAAAAADRDGMLMIGMGSGALPFFMQTHFNRAFEMETVEHDPVVIEAIERTCFNGDAMPFRCVVDDAREYLETKVASGSLDVISMDAFDGGGNVPEHLISREFFRLCGEKLRNHHRSSSNRRSMFIMNCFNGVRGSTAREFVHVICARLEKSIGPVMTIPVHDQPCNVIVVALKRSSEEEEEDTRSILEGGDCPIGSRRFQRRKRERVGRRRKSRGSVLGRRLRRERENDERD
jgi:spermidine synthase